MEPLTDTALRQQLRVSGLGLDPAWARVPDFADRLAVLLEEDFDTWAPRIHAALDAWDDADAGPVLFAVLEARRRQLEQQAEDVLRDPHAPVGARDLMSTAVEMLRNHYARIVAGGHDALRIERGEMARDRLTSLLARLISTPAPRQPKGPSLGR